MSGYPSALCIRCVIDESLPVTYDTASLGGQSDGAKVTVLYICSYLFAGGGVAEALAIYVFGRGFGGWHGEVLSEGAYQTWRRRSWTEFQWWPSAIRSRGVPSAASRDGSVVVFVCIKKRCLELMQNGRAFRHWRVSQQPETLEWRVVYWCRCQWWWIPLLHELLVGPYWHCHR